MEQGEKTLVIERETSQIYEVKDNELLNSCDKINEGSIFGIVGIMNVVGHNYLCVIKEAEDLGVL